MTEAAEIQSISVIGGTGALGSGLAKRWARAGYRVIIGSRSAAKAQEAAATASASIGAGAIVAAGSVVTRPVEADALCLVRPEQQAKAGWAKRFRERMLAKKAAAKA